MGLGRQFLATTGISDAWDIDSEVLFLGPWCLADEKNRKLIEGRPCSIVVSPWKPAFKIETAAGLCREIYEEILRELSEQLNLLHGVSYPQRYWRILVGPWLSHFIEILYERYRRIENAFTVHQNAYTYILPESLCELLTVDTYDFVSIRGKASDDYYNLKLFSLIARYFFPGRVAEKTIVPQTAGNKNIYSSGFAKKMFYGLKYLSNIFSQKEIILSDMYHVDWRQILMLESECRFNSVVFKNFDSQGPMNKNCYSRARRQGLKMGKTADKFQNFLKELIPDAIPMCYVEYFNKYNSKVTTKNVKAVGSVTGWLFNEKFKFFAANSTLTDTVLLDFQHGGGYGMFLSLAETISMEKDIFYTWGWRYENNDKTVPLSSPHLSVLKDSYQKNNDGLLLFIGSGIHKYLCRFQAAFAQDDMPQYFLDKKRFVDGLDEPLRDRLLYRPYQEIGWGEIETVKKMIPGIKIFSDQGRAVNLIKKAKIVVIDHLSTSNLEVMAINAPTVWFWDHDNYIIRPEAETYFELLRDVGILYKSPEDAAKKVNDIYDNPMKWWSDIKVQRARNVFCERFAAASNNWRDEWIEALNEHR
ncbi:MAG: LIC12162 family protein [Candidatus Omnitrophota bacterium]|nr:LIC12162 family protein [Candidatus Omnitrophota bacterium]